MANTAQGVLDVATMRKLSELTCPFELQLFKERCIDPNTATIEGAEVIDIQEQPSGLLVTLRMDNTPQNRVALALIGEAL